MASTTNQTSVPKVDFAVNREASGSVPALDRSLDILEILSVEPLGLTLSQLSRRLNAPKNSVFRITQTLLARGYLARDDDTLAFRLTPRLLNLAPPRWRGISLPEASREAMNLLRDATGETVQLGVQSGKEGVIIDQVEGTRPLRIVVDLGLRFSLHNNAPGKLLLAYMQAAQQRKVFAEIKLPATTSRTITGKSELKKECERIVASGYSTDYAEADEGVHCIAAPIFDTNEMVVGTIWISGPSKRIPKRCFRVLGEQVRTAARQISGRLGGAGMSAYRSCQAISSASFTTCVFACLAILSHLNVLAAADVKESKQLFHQYCIDCHEGSHAEGNLDLSALLTKNNFDATLIFENIATGKMPPVDADSPSNGERGEMLSWLAGQQPEPKRNSFRRISRHEFVNSVNDLLGTKLDLSDQIPEDRGTYDFDSDRRIQLSREVLWSYFTVADTMLDSAFPPEGFVNEQTWLTNKLKDSNEAYKLYIRDHKEGILFSWTRENNGNSYSFFYDNFDPPVSGWYDLTFEAAKVGDFNEHVSIQVHAGKYYYADDRPQPQRLLDVISLGNRELKTYTIRVFLNPGENVSVHCYSKHNWRQKSPKEGAYIRQLKVRGPVQDQWPPSRYAMLFGDLPLTKAIFKSSLQCIGGSISVSSFQPGMEKENMQDGSNKTFWQTKFNPTLAKPPHYVIIENPRAVPIHGLSYATWSGGNGNGQVKAYSLFESDDGQTWGDSIVSGELEVRLANEQPIRFPKPTTKRFMKFLITDVKTLDGRSLASIAKLDVIVSTNREVNRTKVVVDSDSPDALKQVIKRFAERAFSTQLTEAEQTPYIELAQKSLQEHGDFVRATKVGFKSVICSPRFLMAPGEHSSPAHWQAASLARMLWLSVPDAELLSAAADSGSSDLIEKTLRSQIHRMLADKQSDRMTESFCHQWLNLRSWNKVSPSLKLYPKYDDLLHHYLPLETQMYLAHLIRDNMPVGHLIDSNYTFLNQRLAQHYGIDGVTGQHLRKTSFGSEVPRGGLLTMGSVLKITTDGFDTSPILRGAWVSKNIVGMPISPPPETVKAIEPEHGTAAKTLREQIEQHKNNATCYACHKSIDPYGFALENFDSTGQWREKYRVEKPHRSTFEFRLEGYFREGGEVDSSGEISDRHFDDAFGLKKLLLSDHRRVGYNFAKKFFEYVNGYAPDLTQRLALLGMIDEKPDRCRMKDVVTNVLVYSLLEKTP